MRLLIIQALYASMFSAEVGLGLFHHRVHTGWLHKVKRETYAKKAAFRIPKGGSDSDKGEDHGVTPDSEEKSSAGDDCKHDNGASNSDVDNNGSLSSEGFSKVKDAGQEIQSYTKTDILKDGKEISLDKDCRIDEDLHVGNSETDHVDNENVEMMPFDDDLAETSNVEIIPFDDDDEDKSGEAEKVSLQDEGNEERSSPEESNIEIIPFDDQGGNEETCQEVKSVEIIPFDEEREEQTDKTDETTSTVDVIPFDDDGKSGHSSEIDVLSSGSSLPHDKLIGEGSDGLLEDEQAPKVPVDTDLKLQKTNNSTIHESDEVKEDLLETAKVTDELINKRNHPGLRWRILDLLRTWKEQDNDESEDSMKHIMHEKAEEYIQELLAFERDYKSALIQNASLPSLRKAVPHPKTFLHYIAPKIPTIKASPQITLQIISTQRGDVSLSICAIGIVSCLIDLYNSVIKELREISDGMNSDCDESTSKKEVIADRRFEQLAECASCGFDIPRMNKDYCEWYSKSDVFANRIISEELQDSGDSTDVIDSDSGDSPQFESISLSDISRLMQGVLSLEFEKDATIGSHNATSLTIAAIMMQTKQLLSFHEDSLLNDRRRTTLMNDIVDIIRLLFFAQENVGVSFYPTINMCVELLLKDISAPFKSDDIEIDCIVNRLALSEGESAEYESSNSTVGPVNATASLNEGVDPQSRLVDNLTHKQQISILRSLMKSAELKGPLKDIARIILHNTVIQLQKDISKLRLSQEVDSNTHPTEFVNAAELLATQSDDDNKLDGADSFFSDTDNNITSVANEIEPELGEDRVDLESIGDEAMKQDEASGTNTRQRTAEVYTKLERIIYDSIAIINIASSLDAKLASSSLALCLDMIEASGVKTLSTLETVDMICLMSGIANIASSVIIEEASMEVVEMILRDFLQRDHFSFTFQEISSLLHSVATLVSTQSSSITNDLTNEEYVNEFLEHAMERLRSSPGTTVWDLANLVWSYTECNAQCDKSSWDHYEMFGHTAAAVSSALGKEGLYNVDFSYERKDRGIKEVDQSILCKLCYALSSLDLDIDEFLQAVLCHFQEDPERLTRCTFLDHVRLLYSNAASDPTTEHVIYPETGTVVKKCISYVCKESHSNLLSPHNFALLLWSLGKLVGDDASVASSIHIPVYEKQDLAPLPASISIKLVSSTLSTALLYFKYMN